VGGLAGIASETGDPVPGFSSTAQGLRSFWHGVKSAKRFGEEISSGEWAWCLRIAWWSLYNAAHRLIEVAKVPEVDIGTEDQFHSLEACLRAVESESTRNGAV
jgi:hypothetical protein